ncbi:MAG: hypothetical protein IJU51_05810, partial [Clostridia bacterium]|nr:hypothetical protein [Clostridia bacterium]
TALPSEQSSVTSTDVSEASQTKETDALSLWTVTAPLKAELTAFIKAITDESSADFIPVERRIAVFDMDGTLCCETDPGYFDHKRYHAREERRRSVGADHSNSRFYLS